MFEFLAPFSENISDIDVRVKVVANAKKKKVGPMEQDASGKSVLKVYVNSPADKGKANKELIEIISQFWETSKSKVVIVQGSLCTKKVLKVEGDPELLKKIFWSKIQG